MTQPIIDYGHVGIVDPSLPTLIGQCIIGGYVYRGPIAALNGTYFFGDLESQRIFSFRYDGTTVTDLTDWTTTFGTIAGLVSFGEDEAGNLYIVNQGSTSEGLATGGGTIYELVAVPEPASLAVLAAAGLTLMVRRRSRRA